MTLAPGSSPQGTEFFDTEGITYVGGGKFVLIEERDRQANLFTYVGGGIAAQGRRQTVKLGTTIGNIGLEGVSYDPLTGGFIFVKEKDPESIFQTMIDFNAGTATNGSPTATASINLFPPGVAEPGRLLRRLRAVEPAVSARAADESHLLIISQESGQIVNVDRSGTVAQPPDHRRRSGQSAQRAGHDDGRRDDGSQRHPLRRQRERRRRRQSSSAVGLRPLPMRRTWPPTARDAGNAVTALPENTSTASPVKLADISSPTTGWAPTTCP